MKNSKRIHSIHINQKSIPIWLLLNWNPITPLSKNTTAEAKRKLKNHKVPKIQSKNSFIGIKIK